MSWRRKGRKKRGQIVRFQRGNAVPGHCWLALRSDSSRSLTPFRIQWAEAFFSVFIATHFAVCLGHKLHFIINLSKVVICILLHFNAFKAPKLLTCICYCCYCKTSNCYSIWRDVKFQIVSNVVRLIQSVHVK